MNNNFHIQTMVCMSENTPQSPLSPGYRYDKSSFMQAEPLDRLEELAKLQERRQQRLMQLRELRQGKPVSSWASAVPDDAKLSPLLSSGPSFRKKRTGHLSKSLPPNVAPPFATPTLKKASSSGRVEGRGRPSVPAMSTKREESPHPARLFTRMKSVDAPEDDVDLSKRPHSKTRHSSAQMAVRKPSNSRQGETASNASSGNSSRLHKESVYPIRTPNIAEAKTNTNNVSSLNEVIAQAMEATTPGDASDYSKKSSGSSTDQFNDKNPPQTRTPSQSRPIRRLPSNQKLSSLKLFDNNSEIDYTKSAEELSHLIAAMQAEFQALRDAKAHAEAIADKLRTDFTLHQQDTEAQLLALSSENERLKSTEITLQVKLNQGEEKVNKAEKEKSALRSRLSKTHNEKIFAETKVTVLEVENAALRKALDDLAKGRGYDKMSEFIGGEFDILEYARYA